MKICKNYLEKNHFKKFILYFSLFIIPFLLYFQTLNFDFANWDDTYLLIENEDFFSKKENIITSFQQDLSLSPNIQKKLFYRPLMLISYIIDYQWARTNPRYYHLVNIFIHIVSGYLVFIFLLSFGYRKRISYIFTLIFLVHPVLVQSVAWVQGRNDSLFAIFVILSILFFKKYFTSKNYVYFLLHQLSFFAAILMKETGLILPFIYLLFLFLIIKCRKLEKKIMILSTGWIFIILFWWFLRSRIIQYTPIGFYSIKDTFFGIMSYLGKFLFPLDFSPYPVTENITPIYGIITLFIIIILIFFKKIKNPNRFYFGLSYFFIFLIITFKKAFVTPSYIETRIYPAIIGLLIVGCEINYGRIIKKYRYFIITLFISFLSLITFMYSKVYKDSYSLMTYSVQTSPNSWVVHNNLGNEYLRLQSLDSAEFHFKRAIELRYENSILHSNLAIAFERKNCFDSSIYEYRIAINLDSTNITALNNLGLIFFNFEKYDSAKFYFKKACNIDNNDYLLHFNLGNTYFMEKKYLKARDEYLMSIKLNDDYYRTYQYLSYTFRELGRDDSAEYYLEIYNKLK